MNKNWSYFVTLLADFTEEASLACEDVLVHFVDCSIAMNLQV